MALQPYSRSNSVQPSNSSSLIGVVVSKMKCIKCGKFVKKDDEGIHKIVCSGERGLLREITQSNFIQPSYYGPASMLPPPPSFYEVNNQRGDFQTAQLVNQINHLQNVVSQRDSAIQTMRNQPLTPIKMDQYQELQYTAPQTQTFLPKSLAQAAEQAKQLRFEDQALVHTAAGVFYHFKTIHLILYIFVSMTAFMWLRLSGYKVLLLDDNYHQGSLSSRTRLLAEEEGVKITNFDDLLEECQHNWSRLDIALRSVESMCTEKIYNLKLTLKTRIIDSFKNETLNVVYFNLVTVNRVVASCYGDARVEDTKEHATTAYKNCLKSYLE